MGYNFTEVTAGSPSGGQTTVKHFYGTIFSIFFSQNYTGDRVPFRMQDSPCGLPGQHLLQVSHYVGHHRPQGRTQVHFYGALNRHGVSVGVVEPEVSTVCNVQAGSWRTDTTKPVRSHLHQCINYGWLVCLCVSESLNVPLWLIKCAVHTVF